MVRWSLPFVTLLAGGLIGVFLAGPVLQGQAPVPPAIPKELTSYRDVVKNVLPAVVSIEARAKPTPPKKPNAKRKAPADDERVPEELRKFFEEFRSGAPDGDEVPNLGFGSGFLVDPKGVVLTNNHVVDGADSVEVQLKDGRKFTSKDIKVDPKTDLAIVRIDAKTPLPFLELGDSDAMEIGDRVLAVGAPFGLTGSVTHGIISAKGRNGLFAKPGEIFYEDFLQTDAAINPGNSGGPLVSLDGKVIGINSAIKSRSGGFQGVGLAVASNLAKNVLQSLLKDGVVHRGYLGVQIKDVLDADLAKRLGVPDEGGVVVTQVFEGSPSAKAGVQEGDVITGLAGKPIKEGHQLQLTVAVLPLGKPVDLAVVRDGKAKVLQVTIEEQPGDFGGKTVPANAPRSPKRDKNGSVSLDKVGVEAADLTAELAEQLGYKASVSGAVLTQVEPESAAAAAGLRRGMLVTKVEKQPVKSATELRDALDKASLDNGVLLQVQTPQGGTTFVLLKAVGAEK